MSRTGKAPADGTTYVRHRDAIERALQIVCRQLRLPREIADEFSQDMRLHFLDGGARLLKGFQHRSALPTYLFRILSNRFHDWSKSKRRVGVFALDEPAASRLPPKSQIEHACEAAVTRRVLRTLAFELARLEPSQQQLLSLRFDAGLDVGSIAEKMHITRKAAARRLERLAQSLKKRLLDSGLPRRDVVDALTYLRDYGPPPPGDPPE